MHPLRALAATWLSFLSLSSHAQAQAQSTSETITTTTTLFSTSTILTSTITITGTGPAPPPSQATATGTMAYTGDTLQSAVLNSTNYYRAQHQAAALNWDTSLAQYAQNYAEKCLWQHSGGPNGENLAEGYSTPTLSIDAWAAEEKHYDYAKPAFHDSTGHYTQLVWKNTTTVGCGAVQCDDNSKDANGVKGWFLVCEYLPRGNVDGEFGEEVGKSGEGKDGKPGLGGGSRRGRGVGVVVLVGVVVIGLVGVVLV